MGMGLKAGMLAAAMTFGFAAAAEAAPTLIFRGKATWTTPTCLMMKATDGRTYELLGAGPAFPPNTCALVIGQPAGEIGLCFAPTAKIVGWKVLPPAGCGEPVVKKIKKKKAKKKKVRK